ncbi:DUF2853 family protein [Flavobacteriaceae bacterium Ap0902]|nr:DUF2853 family protein [Flavobacteriaceae bacterium Ap0902]
MSKLQEKVDEMAGAMKDMNESPDMDLLMAVCKGLGPALYNSDAAYVATSDKEEVDRLKKNFLIKKLGLSESDDLDGAIDMVTEKMGKSNPRKHRAIFYYLLTKHFKKESIYK